MKIKRSKVSAKNQKSGKACARALAELARWRIEVYGAPRIN